MSQEIVSKFPSDHVKKLLLENHINNAQLSDYDKSMQVLVIMWKEYVEPTFNATCTLCYERVLRNYKALQPLFI